MNNTGLTKWIILLVLLLVTLVLVWNAPAPEAPEVVELSDSAGRSRAGDIIENPLPAKITDVVLKERHFVYQTVDLFSVPKQAKPVSEPQVSQPIDSDPVVASVELPFRYVGKLKEQQKVIYFLMEGSSLYLAQEGDVISEQFRLQKVDDASNELVWLHMPTDETRKMSIEQ